jgi:carbamoyltransferase
MDRFALGIHIGHDRSVSLVKNGTLIGHIAQERIDRIKHSHAPEYPYLAIDALLKNLRVKISQIQSIGVTYSHVEIPNIVDILKEELVERYKLSNDIGFYGIGHHMAHAQSVFYPSGLEEALIIVADGSGDFVGEQLESESVFWGNEKGVELLDRRLQDSLFSYVTRRNFYVYPYMNEKDKLKQISIGRKYEQVTYMLGFGWGQEGKTMGLASYGKSLIDFKDVKLDNLNFDLNLKFIIDQLYQLQQESGKTFYKYVLHQKANIARTVQAFAEKYTLELVRYLLKMYHPENLCLAGGLFLNCVLNHKILERNNIKNTFIIPAAGDDGQSVGAAFGAYNKHYQKRSTIYSGFTPFLGLEYSDKFIINHLNNPAIRHEKLSDKDLLSRTVEKLEIGNTIGILKGRSECGPRALGHRSILANPCLPKMKETLNKRIKFREMFRPFAPIVIEEKQFDYFNLKQTSPFMLLSTGVKQKFRKALPAVTHIDGSARVQSVSKQSDPFMHELLVSFGKISGFPVLLNTSFNLANEPLIESPSDAINTFLRTKLDYLIIENYWIEKLN